MKGNGHALVRPLATTWNVSVFLRSEVPFFVSPFFRSISLQAGREFCFL